MKALTVRQPWASLVSLGVKSIETRSWSSKYRGPLAIHAGLRVAAGMDGPSGMIGRFSMHRDGRFEPWYMLDRQWPGRDAGAFQLPIDLPLGAVVATCTLVDVVPIVGARLCLDHPAHLCGSNESLLLHSRLDEPWPDGSTERMISDQHPYGDFTAGRWAWILEDVVPIKPVPAKGRQGLWTWEPA